MFNLGIHTYTVSTECPYVNPIVDVQNRTRFAMNYLGYQDGNSALHLAVIIRSTWLTDTFIRQRMFTMLVKFLW